MHRRARHLNPQAAGATVAIDARYISSFADGDAIASIVDRAGTTVTRTAGTGVTYETNEIGGQPAVKFDPAGSFRFKATISVTSNYVTVIAVSSKTSNAAGSADDYSRLWSLSNSGALDYNTTNGIIAYYNTPSPSLYAYRNSTLIAARSVSYAVPHISAFRLSGSNADWSINGIATTGTTSATSLNANEFGVGAPISIGIADSFLNGFVGLIIAIPSAISYAMIQRLEHAAALSFKIACS